VTVFNDTVAPTVSVNPVSTPSVATSQTISGSVSDNDAVANVTVQVGSGSLATAAVSGNSWSITLSGLVVGSNLITVRATDRAGNSSTATASITVLAPSVATPAPLTIVDAQLALQMASGLATPTSAQLTRLDVAPYVNGQSVPNGTIDTGDVVVILSKLVGAI
jgi:chitinase